MAIGVVDYSSRNGIIRWVVTYLEGSFQEELQEAAPNESLCDANEPGRLGPG